MTSTKQASPSQGLLHKIAPYLSAFEATSPSGSAPENVLLWIGGLFDTYRSVDYPYVLSTKLPASWSLAQVNLNSSGLQWGVSTLGSDVADLSEIVAYFRKQGRKRIVIMGHSTGCQDCVYYFSGPQKGGKRESVDGVILQAPVSDREAIVQAMPADKYAVANELAASWIADGRADDVLPGSVTGSMFGGDTFVKAPISARRWLSLASPDGEGEDDLFSSDTPAERSQQWFGSITKPVLILYGQGDEFVPEHVDRKALVKRWIEVMEGKGVKVDEKSRDLLGGAGHNLNGNPEEVILELCRRVIGFLSTLD
ncbi:hypothetical protein MBLNU459_g3354t1 [Dothideomycetes sp. NU459]